jgi:hypothetical protein
MSGTPSASASAVRSIDPSMNPSHVAGADGSTMSSRGRSKLVMYALRSEAKAMSCGFVPAPVEHRIRVAKACSGSSTCRLSANRRLST